MFTVIAAAIAVTSAAMGYWAGLTTGDALRQLEKATHRKLADEAWVEIVRLRAQVALHIGKDK